MNNGTLGLSFWLALAGGIVAFGVSLVLGHMGLLTAAIIGAVVFAILLAVLGYALKSQPASALGVDTAAPAAKPAAAAAPAAAVKSAPAASAAAPAATMSAAAPAAAKAASKPAAAKAEAKPAAAKPAAAKPTAKAEAAAKPAAVKSAAAPKTAVAAPKVAAATKPASAKAAEKPAAEKPAAEKPAAEKPAAAKTAAKSAKDEAPAAGSVGKAPATLTAPKGGKADDLKIIEGVGPAMEKLVNGLGFYHYDQIASWTADELAWVDSHLGTFRGRIVRDKWQAQAKLIVSEGVPAFLERAKTNNY